MNGILAEIVTVSMPEWTLCAILVLEANPSASRIAWTLGISLAEAVDRLNAVLAVRDW